MLPAGIVSSEGALLAGVAGAFVYGGAAGAGKLGIAGGLTASVALLLRRCGRRRGAGEFCPHRLRPVRNRMRASVVVFILLSRLRISNLTGDFFDSWRRAGCWR